MTKRQDEQALIKTALELKGYKYNKNRNHLTTAIFNGNFIVRNEFGRIIASIPRGEWAVPEWMK